MTSSDSIKEALELYKKSLQADFEDIIKKESNNIKATTDNSPAGESIDNKDKTDYFCQISSRLIDKILKLLYF